MIKVKHLNKAFGSIPVLWNLNLTVNGPLVLMGPSGCGKTTLLRILMGLETPDSGTVQGVGNIGAVFQESRLCPQLTAVGNICLVGGVNPAQAQAELQTLGFTQAELTPASGTAFRRAAAAHGAAAGAAVPARADPAAGRTLYRHGPGAGQPRRCRGGAAGARRDTVLVTHDEHAADLLGWPVVRLETVGK